MQETVRISNPLPSVSIHEAALSGQSAQVTALLEARIDANLKDPEGRTPLMYASFNGHTEVIKALVKKGAARCGETAAGTPGRPRHEGY